MVLDFGYNNSITHEHLVPKSKGGKNGISNFKGACYRCNQMRGDMDADDFNLIAQDLESDTNAIVTGKTRAERPSRIRERVDRAKARQAVLTGMANPFEEGSRPWRMFEKISSSEVERRLAQQYASLCDV